MADRTVRVTLLAEVQRYREGLRQAARSTAEFGREVTTNTDKSNHALEQLGRGAFVAGGILAAGFGLAVNATMGFDRQMSELGAVAGATSDELGDLRQAALDAGAATAFSASEAAMAATELAKAGLTTSQILGGALDGALDLAAAGGLELARAAEIAAGAMTTFGLSGADVGRVADALAAGANKSVSDVDDLAQALNQSGLVADQMGLSLEETVGTLSMFSQNALNGSDAGTSFRTMLMRLSAPTAEARTLMEELGLEVYGAGGQMLPFAELADEVQQALVGLTEEQRNAAMATLFGQDAIRAANIVMAEGGEGVRQWTEAVSESGFASELADKKLDNLAGDLEALRGSIETALIQGGSQATGALRFLTQGATDAVNALAGMPAPLQAIGIGFAGIGGATLLTVGAVATTIVKVNQLKTSLLQIGPAGGTAVRALGMLGSLGGWAAGIAATAGALTVLHGALEGLLVEDAPDVDDLVGDLIKFAQDGTVAGAAAEVLGSDLRGLNDDLHLLHERRGGFHIDLAEDFDEAVGRIDAFDKALATLVQSGNGEMAAEIIQQLGFDPEGALVTEELNDYTDALAAADTQQQLAAGSAAEVGPAIETTTTPAEDAAAAYDLAAEALQNYIDTVSGVTDPLFALVNAQRRNGESQRDVDRAVQARADAEAELHRVTGDPEATAEDRRRAAEALVDATIGISDAQLAAVESAGDLEAAQLNLEGQIQLGNTSIEEAQAALARWAEQGTITTEQAMLLGAELANDAALAGELHGKEIELVLGIAVDPALAALDRFYAEVEKYAQRGQIFQTTRPGLKQAGGGSVPGSGTGDTVPAWLTPGEYVIRAPAAAALGPEFLGRLNHADAGMVMGFASGGYAGGTDYGTSGGWAAAGWDDSGLRSDMRGLHEAVMAARPVTLNNFGPPDRGARALVRTQRNEAMLSRR